MSDRAARACAALFFLSLFVLGPSVLALVGGASLGSVGGTGANTLAYYSVSQNGDAGMSTSSIEFSPSDCGAFDAGTHPSGWAMPAGRLWGDFGGPYAQFFDGGGAYLGDCSVTRPGHLVAQAGRSSTVVAIRNAALSSSFTMYAKLTQGGSSVVATDGIGSYGLAAFGTGSPQDVFFCSFGTVSAGLNLNAGGFARINNVSTVVTGEISLPLDAVRPRILLMQKSGTVGNCWLGDEGGEFIFTGTATVAAGVGSTAQYLSISNGVGAFGAGTPYGFVDYIRVVDGDGSYFP